MKKFFQKTSALLLVLVLVTSVCVLFSGRKSGLFIDEIYSYGLANSHYAPFLADLKGGNLADAVFTRQELEDYLTVSGSDRFSAGSVYYNQTKDVHPPLYYWLLNGVCSLFPGRGFSMLPGLGLNYVLFILTLILLFFLSYELNGSRCASVMAIGAYGLSVIGLSTFLMIRMYMLLAFLTVLLAFFASKLLKTGRHRYFFLFSFTIFLGLLTQYYFVFYAFFLCLVCCISFLVRKEYRRLAAFSALSVTGVALAVLAFPACIRHIFVGNGEVVSGSNAVENIINTSDYSRRLSEYLSSLQQCGSLMWLAVISLALLLIYGIMKSGKKGSTASGQPYSCRIPVIICIPAILTFFLVSVVSPVLEKRYIYNIVPIFAAGISCPAALFFRSIEGKKASAAVKGMIAAAVLGLSLWEASKMPPDYLFPEQISRNEVLSEYAGLPCVYFNGNYSAPLTADILQLMKFEDFFVTDDASSGKLKEYIGNSEQFVLYITNSWYWAKTAPPWIALSSVEEETGFSNDCLLFEGDMSLTYLMSKNQTAED